MLLKPTSPASLHAGGSEPALLQDAFPPNCLSLSFLPAVPPCSGGVPALLKFLQWFPFEESPKLLRMTY